LRNGEASAYRGDVSGRYIGPLVARVHRCPGRIEEGTLSKRTGVLEFAVLGILHEAPLHGYELRKRVNSVLGSFRAFSYGSLYPCLKQLLRAGLIVEDVSSNAATPLAGKRSKIVYKLTADGKEHFQELLGDSGPSAWEDENFGVHFAFFGRTDAATRLRILEGRRSRLEERLEGFRGALTRTRERMDSYTQELQRHGLESVEREVRWLNELIDSERKTTHEPGTTGTSSSPAPVIPPVQSPPSTNQQ
jgi:DNA-binding PadR family transcriptional regulator